MQATCKVRDSKRADFYLKCVYLLMVIKVKLIGEVKLSYWKMFLKTQEFYNCRSVKCVSASLLFHAQVRNLIFK